MHVLRILRGCILVGFICSVSVGCGGPPQAQISRQTASHLGDGFYPWRAKTLGITVSEAKDRDQGLPGPSGPPPDIAPTMTVEAAAIWRDQCSPCHGLHGRPTADLPVQPRSWGTMGTRMGFTFGGDKMRAGVYRKIMDGKPPHMPSWRGRLSREQVWALVRHIEGFE